MARDYRTQEAALYRTMYQTKEWRALRERALLRDMFQCQHKGCKVSLTRGRDKTSSAVVHHIKPHKGDPELFFSLDNLQSVCKAHHDGDIQSTEALGYDPAIGQDGWPEDMRHPINTGGVGRKES